MSERTVFWDTDEHKLKKLKGYSWENTFEANFNEREINFENYNFHYIDEFKNLSKESKYGVSVLVFRQRGTNYYPMEDEHQISLFHDNLMTVVGMFPNLESLTLENYPLLTDNQFGSISVITLEGLTQISLIKNSSLSQVSFRRIANNCTLLKRMNFSCRFFLSHMFLPQTNNLADERYYNLQENDVVKLILHNNQLNHLILMMNKLSDQALEAIAMSTSIKCLGLIVQDKESFTWNKLFNILLCPDLQILEVTLELDKFLSYNCGKLKITNIFDKFGDSHSCDMTTELFVVICSFIKVLTSIKLIGFILSEELCEILCAEKSKLKMFIGENCQCSFGFGFVEKLAVNCKNLRFVLIRGHFTSDPVSLVSLIDERVIVALIVDGQQIKGDEVRLLRKKLCNEDWFSELSFDYYRFLDVAEDEESDEENV